MLRSMTHEKLKIRNVARRGWTYEMLERYKEPREYIRFLDSEELDALLPNRAYEMKIDSLCGKLE